MYIIIHQSEGRLTLNNEQELNQFMKGKMIIEAAGGMVFNEAGELLMMKRRGFWDMPKGKLDEGETIEECAIREVSEETGLLNLTVIKKLQITYHTYLYNGENALKPSHWYLMSHAGDEELIPQTEEDITEIRWVNKEEARSLVDQAYPSIAEMIVRYYINV
jgi:8-oxo-dGTP pyrophosphatase MutT (NUDIX family)